jgi:hypothetical protein
MKSIVKCMFTAGVVLFSLSVRAELSARELMDKTQAKAASEPVLKRIDTNEQSSVVLAAGQRMEQPSQKSVLQIEIDQTRRLARHSTTIQGKELVMLKQGDKAAMKMGDGSWEIPTGQYEQMAKNMGDLFVCEKETPETEKNAIVWKVTGTEVFDGNDVFVIESQGNSAVAIAQERMTKGLAKAFSANPDQCPTVKVLEYSAKHWISKSDFRHLQAVQTSKSQILFALPDGKQQIVETSSKATSKYSYEKFVIEIPLAAQKLLARDDNIKKEPGPRKVQ